MNRIFRHVAGCLAAIALLSSTVAQAKDIKAEPVAEAGAQIRYLKGVPTIGVTDDNGGVLVTQTDPIYGRLRFRVAMSNGGSSPFNFGVESVTALVDGVPVPVLTAERLEKIAKNKAGWATFAMALAGGLAAAGAQANAYRSYDTVSHTPYGTYTSHTTSYDPTAAAIGTAAATAGTVYGISRINESLDRTLEAIQDNVIQTTTIDPGSSYGGLIVIDKFKKTKAPQRLELIFKRGADDTNGYRVAYTLGG